MLDRIVAVPSLPRSTTAAAVSSQVVSIPSTNVLMSLANVVSQYGVLRFREIRRFPIR
jgi:hypothetical protein